MQPDNTQAEDNIIDVPPKDGLTLEERILKNAGIITNTHQPRKHSTAFQLQRGMRRTYTENNARLFRPVFDAIIKSGFTEERIIPYTVLNNTPQTIYLKVCDALKYLNDVEFNTTPPAARLALKGYAHLKANYKVTKELSPTTGAPLGVGLRKRSNVSSTIESVVIPKGSALETPTIESTATNNPAALLALTKSTRIASPSVALDPLTNTVSSKVDPQKLERFVDWKELVLHFIQECPTNLILKITLDNIVHEDEAWLAAYFSSLVSTTLHMDYVTDKTNNTIKVMKLEI